ncbi:hypothetical protein KZ294_27040, partial [Escherichia coli]
LHTHQIRGQDNDPRIGKGFFRLLRNPFDTRPAGNEVIQCAAGGTGFRPRLMVAALMADELTAEPVLDQPA